MGRGVETDGKDQVLEHPETEVVFERDTVPGKHNLSAGDLPKGKVMT